MDTKTNTSIANLIEQHLSGLHDATLSLLRDKSQSQDKIDELVTDLKAFKAAYNSSESSKRQLEETLEQMANMFEKEKHELELKLSILRVSERRVMCLIDGDGTIFSSELIARGQEGGHMAAKTISETIRQEIVSSGLHQFHLWVYVFYNKRGLLDTFARAGFWDAKSKFDDFVMGFNQSAERFLMVDAGSGKEAADAKLKVYMEDNIRLPQTYKVIFGGCHDNGYVNTLRSLITAGFREKIILLRGYADMAADIENLQLASITIPEIFLSQKIVVPSTLPVTVSSGNSQPKPRSQSLSGVVMDKSGVPVTPLKSATATPLSRPAPAPTSYASALQVPTTPRSQASTDRPETPELDFGGSSASSDISDVAPSNSRTVSPFTISKRITPGLPLSKHKPPPCTLFYLAECRHGTNCKYSHEYLLEEEHYEEIRRNAKNAPCPAANRGEVCGWGDFCCYGHVCPQGTKCFFLKQGRCKFVGDAMHKDGV